VRAAWARAGQPDFVEGHGTGTAVGDKVELEALASAAGPEGRTIGVTSLKSILGHTKAAAGIGAFLKAVIAANRRVLPPTAGCVDPNLVFDGPAQALYPLRRGEVRGAGASVKAGASAMGFGGINTHAVVVSGDAPDPALAPALSEAALLASAQDSELFVFGADSLSALRESVRVLVSVAARIARSELVDLSAALLDRLPTGAAVRAAVIASTPQELVARLERLLTLDRADGPEVWLDRPVGTPRLGFLCPGQGSQALE
jgi:acyl transferase domain-containing protein